MMMKLLNVSECARKRQCDEKEALIMMLLPA